MGVEDVGGGVAGVYASGCVEGRCGGCVCVVHANVYHIQCFRHVCLFSQLPIFSF